MTLVFLPQPPKCWDFRSVWPHPRHVGLENKAQALWAKKALYKASYISVPLFKTFRFLPETCSAPSQWQVTSVPG